MDRQISFPSQKSVCKASELSVGEEFNMESEALEVPGELQVKGCSKVAEPSERNSSKVVGSKVNHIKEHISAIKSISGNNANILRNNKGMIRQIIEENQSP